jgi:multidrug efflux system membrane fusion protein
VNRRSLLLLIVCSLLLAVALGCQGDQAGAPQSETLAVPVSLPVQRDVTNFEEFTGRSDAIQVVDLRARVTGYLVNIPFQEGAEVSKGELLFEIDERPYQAQYDQAVAQEKLNDASLKLAQTTLTRDLTAGDSVAPQQLDQDKAAVEEARARLDASKASTKVYKLNLEFCKVMSPIDGKVSRTYLTRGNLINQDQTLLTTLVSLDPMFAYFDLDEPSYIRILKAVELGRLRLPEEGKLRVFLGLPGEDNYPHEGRLNFVNNQLNSGTGSIAMRGIFPNPKVPRDVPSLTTSMMGLLGAPEGQGSLLSLAPFVGSKGTRLLAPGMFVRIRLPLGEPYPAILIIDRAIQSDQGIKYIYVVDENNKVEYRKIKTGALQEDGLRVIEDGLKANEYVVVGALQTVRQKMEVRKDVIAMPTLGQQKDEKGKSKGN